jgi:RND superfamily putative drug exporter
VLEKWGRWASRHHWRVVVGWIVLMAAVWAVGISLDGKASNEFTLPGSSSQDALDLLDANFPTAAGTSATVVYKSRDGKDIATDSALQAKLKDSVTALGKLDGVTTVVSPFDNSALFSKDGTVALVNVAYADPVEDLPNNGVDAFDDLTDAVSPYRSSALQIELGGPLPGAQPTEIEPMLVVYGLIAALVILAVALGTWWSFAWPVVGALIGVGLGVGLVRILEDFVSVPTISETAAVMIGLGVGVDYGLFVIGRAKDYVDEGQTPEEAAGHAAATIGRAVLTAGATVVIALVALLVFDVPAVTAMAYAVVVVVAGVVLSALTLQPAIVGAVGPRLATSHVPWAHRDEADEADGGAGADGTDEADASARSPRPTILQRWAGLVTRHAAVAAVLAVGVLLVLAIPVFEGDLRLGPLDNSLLPTGSTQYRAWEIESDAFGPGSTDPFLVVVEIPSGDASAQAQVTTLIQDVQAADGVASVTPPQVNDDKSIAAFEVIPSHGAQTQAAADLVDRLRDDTLPEATDGTDLKALVTGNNAVFVDLDERIEDRLPQFIGIVVLVAIVILGLVFRSLAIPLKAAVFSVLTILATYGVLVAFLTFGWGRSWIGIPADIPILSLLAPVFFAVLFGLSNDYEVYLVTRMHEEREGGADAAEAVRRGLGEGGRIVIAAALIMVFVFASYMFQPGAAVKQFGFGMAVAILLDAFVTRMTLLPAVMRLGREAMWWPGIRGAHPAPGPGGAAAGRKRTRGPQQVPTS